MCGIVAIVGKHKQSACEKALSRIKHRGEDGSKIFNSTNVSIGFNRLAINDETENGMQPFQFENLIGVFNGEIFNTAELATTFGITLNTQSDIEIILPLFKKVGDDIIDLLDGFYSGVIFNKATKELFTLRDYIGKKPLFYGSTFEYDFICSELKSVDGIQSFEFVPKGFAEVINNQIVVVKNHTYPSLPTSILKDTITKAVIKRIPKNSSSKFGVFLSGGLDSSIIASIVSKHSSNVIYYTLGNSNQEDFSFVKSVTKRLAIDNQLRIIPLPSEKEISDLIDKVVYHTESYNPSIISNGLATYLLSKAAKKDGLKVVLSGEGADELFCGYKISKDLIETRRKSKILIENLHFTELRRLDLASMSNTIEVRCPFLDKKVYAISKELTAIELKNKQILRNEFAADLPKEIIERKKTSFDVGSGIRKLVVEFLTKSKATERASLKKIWSKYFDASLAHKPYFSQYPVFDKSINTRGINHK